MDEERQQLVEEWTEDQVSHWLRTIGLKDKHITKLHKEDVDGQVLLSLTYDNLTNKLGVTAGPALLLIQKRDELIRADKKCPEKENPTREETFKRKKSKSSHLVPEISESDPPQIQHGDPAASKEGHANQETPFSPLTSKEDCRPRPFDKESFDFTYVRGRVLQPESGVFDLIYPCHEYKSFATAATLERRKLQAKFANEVFRFGAACMNIRSNGTIHFGVMDSVENTGYVHGEIKGIPVEQQDMYVDALDHIEKSFLTTDRDDVRRCIRPPRFVEVLDRGSLEKRYVVEVDIVPSLSVVKGKVYSVRLPNFKESSNKVEFEKSVVLRRVGSKTEPVNDEDKSEFYHRATDRDALREEAENSQSLSIPDISQDLGRKLTMLLTDGKKSIGKDKWFILVTNKFKPDDLYNIDWLLNLNIFCVFDFDPESKSSGLCGQYIHHHAANMHFTQDYRIPNGMSVNDFVNQHNLFDQTSWIFCNGRTDYKGDEPACDEMTWIKTKMTLLKESVSLICKEVLPRGTFMVIFLLTSPVEKPLLHTFLSFFTDMNGHEDIVCICISEEDFPKWQNFTELSCAASTVNNYSIVGMKMSHVDATLQKILPITSRAKKQLPVFVKGQCLLEKAEEERMHTLEILSINHCDEISEEEAMEEKDKVELQFYRGGNVTWKNFWLAEKQHVGEMIERDAYHEVFGLVNNTLQEMSPHSPVSNINIYHHPGSGGSTVARQVLWNKRKHLRCAVVRSSYSVAMIAEQAVNFREYEERDSQKCLPVLLLIEDADQDFLDDLRRALEDAMHNVGANHMLCFILLRCSRSHNPQKKCKESPLQNVSVTHKLSETERKRFAGKRQILEKRYQPEFILTFVLMSEEFDMAYIKQFVEHLLEGIDHRLVVTRLILYVALLNTYVPKSFLSQSHCEALLDLTIRMERFRRHEFETFLSEQAKLIFVHLRDETTHIKSIRIIHPLVAKEILLQLLGKQTSQSSLAKDLLNEKVLFEHRFGKDHYLKFLKALFIRRFRKDRGDEFDSLFSPLVEHVCEKESPEEAVGLLEEAYERFHKNAFFAQQLARLHYNFDKFEKATDWAETAVKQMPNNSYILDTKGQVYKRWSAAKFKALAGVPKTPQSIVDAMETALKAMECFRKSQDAAMLDNDSMNTSGFFAEVEIGFNLVEEILSLQPFPSTKDSYKEWMKYLVTDYIPEEVKEPWKPFHDLLKNVHNRMQDTLEWISEELSYFQTDIGTEEEQTVTYSDMKIHSPLAWLERKSALYGKFFSGVFFDMDQEKALEQCELNPTSLSPFKKRMLIYALGGGNITSILSKLPDHKNKDSVKCLESILSLYPKQPAKANLPQRDLVNYIVTHVALSCLSPLSPKVAPLQQLQTLSKRFQVWTKNFLPRAVFLLTMLLWPEDLDTDYEKESKYETIQSAVKLLTGHYREKVKNIPPQKRRIYTPFFLGNGLGLKKIVHKSKVEMNTQGLWDSVPEKRIIMHSGRAWKSPEISLILKRLSGWTEDRTVYLEGPKKTKFAIPYQYGPSVPRTNENITFYLGFTFKGPVAYDITVEK